MVRLWADCRYACRPIAVHRESAIAVVAVVGIGVGALVGAFALVDPYLFRPLPYRVPGELVAVSWTARGFATPAVEDIPTVEDWTRSDLFSAAATYGYVQRHVLDVRGQYVAITTIPVGADFFAVLGGPGQAVAHRFTAAGRFQNPSLATPIVLTAGGAGTLLQSHGDPLESGSSLRIRGGGSFEVLGTLGPEFILPDGRRVDGLTPHDPDYLATVTVTPQGRIARREVSALVARLRPGLTPGKASTALSTRTSTDSVRITPVADLLTERVRPAAWGIGLTGLLILFVCTGNVANLTLVRFSSRRGEAGVRSALGGTRSDLFRLWAMESGVLVALAALVGCAGAGVLLRLMASLIPVEYLTFGPPTFTVRVVLFAVLTSALVWLIGMVSIVFLLTRRGDGPGWRQSTHAHRATRSWRLVTIGMQTGLSMVLAVGASLTGRSYLNLVGQESGYDEGVLVVSLLPSVSPQGDEVRVVPPALRALRALPGVTAVAATNGPIVGELVAREQVTVAGERVFVDVRGVTPEFFEVAGTPVVRGRVFATEDAVPMPLVVNESFDRRYLRAEPLNAVTVARGGGRALRPGQIVGVVGDVVDGGLAAPVSPTVYYRLDLGEHALSLRYLLRAPGEIRPADAQIRRALFAATPESTVASIDTIHGRLGRSIRERTFAALMFTLLALAGGAVAVFGIAGVVAHTVSSRLRDLAIRHVLGARSSDLRRATAGDAILAGASGSLVGFVVSMWLSRWLQSLAYGVEVGSWSEFAAVAVCGVLLVTVAALVPTRRLDRTSLTQVLRQS